MPVREDGAIELNVMTFNIRCETTRDTGEKAWHRRISPVVQMLRAENPDIVAVQEAFHGQVADLRVSLPDYDFHGRGRDDGQRKGEYAGIFYRRDRFETDAADQGVFWLSDTPETPGSRTWGNGHPRMVAWVRLLDRATGRGFYAFNTHWDHQHQGSREKSAVLMAEKIDSRARPDEPVVLLGDFNAVETNPATTYLAGRETKVDGTPRRWNHGMLETFGSLHPQRENRRTLHLWRGSTEGGLKIDHVFASRGAEVLEAEIVTRGGRFLSDHFPVSARVLFR